MSEKRDLLNQADYAPPTVSDLPKDDWQRRALTAEARRINLGPNCAKCICSICPDLLECGTMCGNTAMYCITDCKGENGCMGACSEGAAMIAEQRKRGGE